MSNVVGILFYILVFEVIRHLTGMDFYLVLDRGVKLNSRGRTKSTTIDRITRGDNSLIFI